MDKNLIKTKTFLCSIIFTPGGIVGYIQEIFNLKLKIINVSLGNLGKTLSHFLNFVPTADFLSDVAAFEAVVIAIAIPLSFEIVSRISERYRSEVISKKFVQEWAVQLLPTFLIFNIILAVALRFFVNSNPTSIVWKLLAWIAFIGFLIIAGILLFCFIPRLKHYMTESEFVLEELFNEAEKSLK